MSQEDYHTKSFVGPLHQLEQDAPFCPDDQIEYAVSLTHRLLGRLQLNHSALIERRAKHDEGDTASKSDGYLTVKEAAKKFSLSEDLLYRCAAQIPGTWRPKQGRGRAVRLSEDGLRKWGGLLRKKGARNAR